MTPADIKDLSQVIELSFKAVCVASFIFGFFGYVAARLLETVFWWGADQSRRRWVNGDEVTDQERDE